MEEIPAVFIPAAPVAQEPVEYAVPPPPGMDAIHQRDQEAAEAMIQSAWRDMQVANRTGGSPADQLSQASKAMQQHWQTTHGIEMPSSLPRTSLNQQAPRANLMDPGWMKVASTALPARGTTRSVNGHFTAGSKASGSALNGCQRSIFLSRRCLWPRRRILRRTSRRVGRTAQSIPRVLTIGSPAHELPFAQTVSEKLAMM